ncbi:MAG TPA: PA domain-containing protein, partial [Myxococcaceae bacterium]|nr:PA domain-containing protein [Myxococcaceae bacterium]
MRALPGLLGAALLLAAPTALANATILIVNGDGPNTGFNDPTPVTPVGGNAGTTLGAQRLAVFQQAAAIWGAALDSEVPITVFAHFQPLTCGSTGATLGSAGPTNIFSSDDPSLDGGVSPTIFPKPKTWYVSAETQRFASVPLLPGTGDDEANYDIVARFNSSLDTPQTANCNGLTWYYGLDNQHENSIDLLTVVLHEFGHGLGFLSLTNNSSGEFPPMNEPDIWAYYLYDETSETHWKDMTASERAASAISGGLAWDGPSVTSLVPDTLAFPPLVRVTSAPDTPSAVKDYDQIRVAQFSGPIPVDGGVSGPLEFGSTGWGCTVQGPLDPLDGRIALLDRGGPNDAGCTFVEKARNAQDAGAIGLLIANNVSDPALITPSGTAPDVLIPVLFMTQADGTTLKNAVAAGPVNVSMVRDSSQGYSGADSAHRAMLYSPTTLEQGSSVSHWDTTAFPNLLMEPVINGDLQHVLDLTVPLFRDIGWFPVDLSITGTGPSSLSSGQQGTFHFTVTNPGPYVAPAVKVTSLLTGLTFVSNSGDCTTNFPCVLGDLAAGQSKTFTTTLKPGTSSTGNGSASLTADSVSATSIANVANLA